jgi:dihydroorotate dehydrogenase (fumarate)
MERWMAEREYVSVAQLKGSMSQQNLPDPSAVERASYIRLIENFAPPSGVWR